MNFLHLPPTLEKINGMRLTMLLLLVYLLHLTVTIYNLEIIIQYIYLLTLSWKTENGSVKCGFEEYVYL